MRENLNRLFNKMRKACRIREVRMLALDAVPAQNKIEHYPESIIAADECITMPFTYDAFKLHATSFKLPPGRSRQLSNVIFCSKNHMLLDERRRIIEEGSSTVRTKEWFSPEAIYRGPVINLEGTYSCIRSVHNNYYHSLIDNIPRLFLLHHPFYADNDIQVLFPGGATPLELFFWEKLCPPNARILETKKNGLYRCEQFVFPEFLTRRFSGALPPQYLEFLRSQVLPDRPSFRSRKIFISRTKVKKRRIINEEELMQALGALGFERVILEDLNLQQQIEIFYDAIAVVAPHGAGLTNLLFSKHVDVLELHPKSTLLPHFYFLTKSLSHRYQYWCGNERDRDDSFLVDIPAVISLLCSTPSC